MRLSPLEQDTFVSRIESILDLLKEVNWPEDDVESRFLGNVQREVEATGKIDSIRASMAKDSLGNLSAKFEERMAQYREAENIVREWLHS